ncbi:GNAT family N-acetyltransferase [Aquimarina sp. BL5]|uniref:GNAT family N-acetyltransferase n=1 Tax=Aquimarina sp. BL5 TaxID=1714860 RepID=UPI000E491274|nr:GNAT family N-acetyltransferase [Aquimarina sp. BL5]AXT50686.1 GNAT family N-acetyltransferase [Aquimarina sp. BL5]RKM94215.1 GNAT family N-acetyltransferase [Aquimarina sp. BL5]
MEINTLIGIDTKDILNVFNESFSDYFIPFQLTEEQLNSKMLADKVHLNLSVGVFEDKKLIAFILHGFDKINNEKIVYNGGTGVIPKKRGLGLTKQMYNFILPVLKEKGINKSFLEVISKNTPAIKSYKKSGYKIERELNCYKGEIVISNLNNNLEIYKLQDYDWILMQSFWDITPTWQNSNNVVDQLKNTNISLGAYIKNQLVGYIIYNPNNKRLQQIAIDKNFRQRKIASTLMSKLIEDYGQTCSIINVDKSSKSVDAFLQKIGFKINLEQLEMKLQLDKTNANEVSKKCA